MLLGWMITPGDNEEFFTVRVLLENVSKFICGVFKVGASTTDLLQGIAEVLILIFLRR